MTTGSENTAEQPDEVRNEAVAAPVSSAPSPPEPAAAEPSEPKAEVPSEEPEDQGPMPPDDFDDGPAEPLSFIDEAADGAGLESQWYILKVQVNREDSIKDALVRRVKMHGLEKFFQEIIVPTEDVAEFTKTGKRRVVKRKIYPGYILVKMMITDDTWFVVRETSGIGDFTGAAGKPSPMDPKDVEKILKSVKVIDEGAGQVRTAIPFKVADRVRVKEGYFQNFEGDIDAIDQANGRVTVMINIFGRSTPVELEHWQIEAV